MTVLGLDTSNYTTSAALYSGLERKASGKLLEVKPGELGLRQSEALFQHIKRLPEIMEGMLEGQRLSAVGASTRPRAVEGSYMPCFLAGQSQGQVLAQALGVPFYGFSHQQGHLAAVLESGGHMELMERPFLAWHLSGGTTELLYVHPGLQAEKIGGTEDLSAGQLIDRTGQRLGLNFPAGKAIDRLAGEVSSKGFPVKVRNMTFSLSGMENKVRDMATARPPEETAAFALACIVRAVEEATEQARGQYGNLPVVFTGGVASNRQLRRRMIPLGGVFGPPEFSADNALGIAVLTYFAEIQHG